MARILVIDDEAPIRSLLATILHSAGHEVVEASSGREGLWVYRQRSTGENWRLLDLLMPEFSGLDTILEFTREFLNVKVVAIPGMANGDQSLQRTARLLGARQSLRKPFGIEELLCAVRYELTH